eukprot:scaffold268930_cov33-Tisochrysis_lutea.AAC.3
MTPNSEHLVEGASGLSEGCLACQAKTPTSANARLPSSPITPRRFLEHSTSQMLKGDAAPPPSARPFPVRASRWYATPHLRGALCGKDEVLRLGWAQGVGEVERSVGRENQPENVKIIRFRPDVDVQRAGDDAGRRRQGATAQWGE